jgi:cysteine-rich repeat protein
MEQPFHEKSRVRGMTRIGVLALLLVVSCVHSESIDCGDYVCPQGTACAVAIHQCVSDAQKTACDGHAEGTQCTADETPGVCNEGYCLAGCGDGVEGSNEECDDGNFANHDGCSSICLLETMSWQEVRDPWTPIAGLAVAHLDHNGGTLVRFGGYDQASTSNAHWERNQGVWKQITTGLPSPRQWMAYGYDSDRDVLVVFGGDDNDHKTTFDETWEYNGTAWTQIATIGKPSPRWGAAMAFDETRDVFVLFGGFEPNGVTLYSDTWEYNPATKTWTNIPLTTKPSARFWHAMTWDAAAQRVVLYGGIGGNQTAWKYDGTNRWVPIGGTGPSSRPFPAMTYDPTTQRVVVFGGRGAGGVADTLNDTWELNTAAGTWAQHSVLLAPPGRYDHAMVYDPESQRALSFGGYNGNGFFDDVWQLSTTSWTNATPRYAPGNPQAIAIAYDSERQRTVALGLDTPAATTSTLWEFDGAMWSVAPGGSRPRRTHYAIAYDAVRKRTVIFGGLAPGSVPSQQTWEWDGARWSEPTVDASPPARYFGTMVQAGPSGGALLFGGYSASTSNAASNDTWLWDGAAWHEIQTPAEIPPEAISMMTYDAAAQRVVMLTGDSATWVFQDGSWTKLSLAQSPPPRRQGALIFRPERGKVLLYGGGTGETDTWELDGDTWRELQLIGERPPPRVYPGNAYHESVRSMVLYGGGTVGGGLLEDTWLLSYGSLTNDEVCGNGVDDDGDQLTDTDDPDC